MFRYIKKHSLLALLALCTSLIVQIASPISAVLEQKLIDFIISGSITDFQEMFWYVALIVLATGIFYSLKALAENRLKAQFAQDLRNDLYNGIMRKDPAAFRERDTAEYISLINNDVDALSSNFASPIWTLAGIGFSTVFSLVIMLSYSPLLTATAVLCSFLSFLTPSFLTKQVRKKLVEKTACEAAFDVRLKESLNGYDAIFSFGVLPKIRTRFEEANRARAEASFRLASLISLLENSSAVIGRFVRFLTFLIAGLMAIREQISVGTVLLFVSLYSSFSTGILILSQCIPLLRSSKPIIGKLKNIIDCRESAFTGREIPAFSREISVKNLQFQYQKGIPILTGFDLTIRKREKLVLLGASGCGKSTFLRLLSGNYADYHGGIYYDGMELRQLEPSKLRKVVTVIHQNTHIFNDTIRYNICLGEDFPEEDFRNALRLSGVDRFLPSIQGGVDASCGEAGANLSGGQKQRIALARALVRKINFLILDEGVSAIDVETANEIEQELLDIENLTLLTVTHRIRDGLLARYDRVLSMADGKITETAQIM